MIDFKATAVSNGEKLFLEGRFYEALDELFSVSFTSDERNDILVRWVRANPELGTRMFQEEVTRLQLARGVRE